MDPSFWDLRRPALYAYQRRWARHRTLAAYNIDRYLYQPNHLQRWPRQQTPFPSFNIDLSPPHRTLAAYNIDSSRLSDQSTETKYIYCIKLPHFGCKPLSTSIQVQLSSQQCQGVRQARRYAPYPSYPHRVSSTNVGLGRTAASYIGTSGYTALAKQLQPQQTLYEVVKIGKTKRNPAQRFHEILGPFQNLPEVRVPLLQEISSTDDQQTVLQKVESCDDVIFLVEVQDIGTAEQDIRKALGIPLGQGFIDQFLASINDEEQKQHFKDDSGMTEWVVMDAKLATHLQTTFRIQSHPFVRFNNNILWPYGTPSGDEVRWQLLSQARDYYCQRIGSTSLPPGFHISFPPTNFSYTLHTPT